MGCSQRRKTNLIHIVIYDILAPRVNGEIRIQFRTRFIATNNLTNDTNNEKLCSKTAEQGLSMSKSLWYVRLVTKACYLEHKYLWQLAVRRLNHGFLGDERPSCCGLERGMPRTTADIYTLHAFMSESVKAKSDMHVLLYCYDVSV